LLFQWQYETSLLSRALARQTTRSAGGGRPVLDDLDVSGRVFNDES
jgi:hypothetical protein